MSTHPIRLVPFDRSYLERSWEWLNDPEIKRMTLSPDFTRAEQEEFFCSLPQRTDYLIWGVASSEGTPVGVAGLKHIFGTCAEFWCYIGERDWWGRGAGGQILDACESEARKRGITTLTMVASTDNSRSLGAYRRAGFVDDPELPKDRPDLVSLTKWLKA